MIYPLAGLVIGALFGAYRARSRGGKTLDIAQWATVNAILFGIVGLFVLVAIERAAV